MLKTVSDSCISDKHALGLFYPSPHLIAMSECKKPILLFSSNWNEIEIHGLGLSQCSLAILQNSYYAEDCSLRAATVTASMVNNIEYYLHSPTVSGWLQQCNWFSVVFCKMVHATKNCLKG